MEAFVHWNSRWSEACHRATRLSQGPSARGSVLHIMVPISFPHSLRWYRAPGTQLGNEGKMWTKSYQSSWRWDLDLLDNISLDLPMKTFGEELNGSTHVQCGHHYPRLNGKQERNYQYLSPSVSWLWMKCDCHLMFLLPRPPHWSGLDALKLWTKV